MIESRQSTIHRRLSALASRRRENYVGKYSKQTGMSLIFYPVWFSSLRASCKRSFSASHCPTSTCYRFWEFLNGGLRYALPQASSAIPSALIVPLKVSCHDGQLPRSSYARSGIRCARFLSPLGFCSPVHSFQQWCL